MSIFNYMEQMGSYSDDYEDKIVKPLNDMEDTVNEIIATNEQTEQIAKSTISELSNIKRINNTIGNVIAELIRVMG